MQMYAPLLKDTEIVGFDIGGGTPLKLSVANIGLLKFNAVELFNIDDTKVKFSIETTPIIAKNEFGKLIAVRKMGFKRISMGIQTVSESLLKDFEREGSAQIYQKAILNMYNAGFSDINIDLMYGFLNQTEEEFANTVKYAISMEPTAITLYRNRYKGTSIEHEAKEVSLEKVNKQYNIAFDLLNKSGFFAGTGKNTFSSIVGDYGTSDYLTTRVIEAVPYLGLGLGAQSFGSNYLAYNSGAANKRMNQYREKLSNNEFPIQDIYKLPLPESLAKAISVAFYFGFIRTDIFSERFGIDFEDYFKDEISFCIDNMLMAYASSNCLHLTELGSDKIAGVIPLFYSGHSQEELLNY